jgi:tetratricopeptide (TPR) repeat protein
VSQYPESEPYRQTLSTSLNNLGLLCLEANEPKEGEEPLRAAIQLQERLVKENAKNPEHRRNLGGSLRNLGLILGRQQRWPDARIALQKALDVREQLAVDFPLDTTYVIDSGTAYAAVAFLLRDAGNPQQSLKFFEKAIEIMQAVLPRVADNLEARRQLCDICWGRAGALERLGRHRDAQKDWERAARLADGTTRAQIRLERALFLAHAGQAEEAVAAAEEVEQDGRLDH